MAKHNWKQKFPTSIPEKVFIKRSQWVAICNGFREIQAAVITKVTSKKDSNVTGTIDGNTLILDGGWLPDDKTLEVVDNQIAVKGRDAAVHGQYFMKQTDGTFAFSLPEFVE